MRFLFLLIVSTSFLFAQSPRSAGIYFAGEHVVEDTSYLDLTPLRPVSLPQSFSLSFDLAIWDPEKYGIIFRLNSRHQFSSILTYDCAFSPDTGYFILSMDTLHSVASIAIPKSDLHRGRWHSFSFAFDFHRGFCRARSGERVVSVSRIGTRWPGNASLVFGHAEDPTMNLRNIAIREMIPGKSTSLLHFWPLDEHGGETVHDAVRSLHGRQRNLEWLAPQHYRWKTERTFPTLTYHRNTLAGRREFGTRPLIDTRLKRLLLFDSSHVRILNWRGGSESVQALSDPDWLQMLVIDTIHGTLYNYQVGGGTLSRYDSLRQSFEPMDYIDPDSLQHYGCEVFVNPIDGEVLRFGGYGWFTMKNLLSRFDFGSREWREVITSGSPPPPRCDFGLTFLDSTRALIFGGFGNRSGKQSDGFHLYRDLWSLDLRTYTWTKLWEKPALLHRKGFHSVVADRENGELYILELNVDAKPFLLMFRASLDGSRYEQFGDTLDEHYGNLWADFERQQLYILGERWGERGTRDLILYSMSLPLHSPHTFVERQISENNFHQMWIYALLTAVGIGGYIFHRLRNGKGPDVVDGSSSRVAPQVIRAPIQSDRITSAIFVFGSLRMYDRGGDEITAEFPPKLSQLFLLILFSMDGSDGITTEELTSRLWPESSADSSKNARGVAFHKLREFLKRIGDIEILYTKKKWRIQCNDGVYCDYLEYLGVRDSLRSRGDQLRTFLGMCERGRVLKDNRTEEIDSMLVSINNEILYLLEKQLSLMDGSGASETRLTIIECIFAFEPLHEKALEAKVRYLLDNGLPGEAKRVFGGFTSTFRDLHGEDYPRTFHEFLPKDVPPYAS